MYREPKKTKSTSTKYPRPPVIHPNRVQVSTIPQRMSAKKQQTNKMAEIIRSEPSHHGFCSRMPDHRKSHDMGCLWSLQTVAAYLHLRSDMESTRRSSRRASFAKAISRSYAKSLGTGMGGNSGSLPGVSGNSGVMGRLLSSKPSSSVSGLPERMASPSIRLTTKVRASSRSASGFIKFLLIMFHNPCRVA